MNLHTAWWSSIEVTVSTDAHLENSNMTDVEFLYQQSKAGSLNFSIIYTSEVDEIRERMKHMKITINEWRKILEDVHGKYNKLNDKIKQEMNIINTKIILLKP